MSTIALILLLLPFILSVLNEGVPLLTEQCHPMSGGYDGGLFDLSIGQHVQLSELGKAIFTKMFHTHHRTDIKKQSAICPYASWKKILSLRSHEYGLLEEELLSSLVDIRICV